MQFNLQYFKHNNCIIILETITYDISTKTLLRQSTVDFLIKIGD